jgi:hypothetical protein
MDKVRDRLNIANVEGDFTVASENVLRLKSKNGQMHLERYFENKFSGILWSYYHSESALHTLALTCSVPLNNLILMVQDALKQKEQ